MSTPFLQAFSLAIVSRLLETEGLAITGPPTEVARFVAAELAKPSSGRSLISSVAAALIACPDVDDLFADNDRIKDLVDELGENRG